MSLDNSIAAWIVEAPGVIQGRVKVCMVGDDRDFYTDTSRVAALDEDGFCGGCGQIGCGHG